MAILSDAQLAATARASGLSGDAVATAVAVALAESGGNPSAHNPLPPDDSYGLWQINMYGSLGPERRQRFSLSSNAALYDPATNARVMFALSSGGTNWKPWSTYVTGKYLLYLPRARSAAGSSNTTGGFPTQPTGLVDSLSGFTALFRSVTDPQFWKRVGLLLAGAGLILYGVMKLTGDNQLSATTKDAIKTVIAVVPK